MIFIIKGFRTIVFIFSVISTTFRPSSGVFRTREPTQNFELRLLLNPQGSPVLILFARTGYKRKYSCIVNRPNSGLNLQTPDDCRHREPTPIIVTLCVLQDSLE